MASQDDLKIAMDLAPAEAVAFLKAKGYKITWDWRETMKTSHERFFTVAKAMNLDLLQDIKTSVDRAVTDGITFQDFKKEVLPALERHGWASTSGVAPHRLRTIFQTNVQSAYNAGRQKRQFEVRNHRPYWMLIEIRDQVSRLIHASRSQSIARYDSSFWKAPASWYPPNGYNCRGRIRALTEEQARSRGISIKGSGNPDKGFGFPPSHIPRTDNSRYSKDVLKTKIKIKNIR